MEFKNRQEFSNWLSKLLYDTIGHRVDDVYGESGVYGREEIFIRTKNDDEITLTIKNERCRF